MKRILCIILSLLIILSGCSGKSSNNKDSDLIDFVLNRDIYEFKNDMPDVYTAGVNMSETKSYIENWKLRDILNEEYYEDINWIVTSVGEYMEASEVEATEYNYNTPLIIFSGINKTVSPGTKVIMAFAAFEDSEIPLVFGMELIRNGETTRLSINDLLDMGIDIEYAIIMYDANCCSMLDLISVKAEEYVTTTNNSTISKPTQGKTNKVSIPEFCEKFCGIWIESQNRGVDTFSYIGIGEDGTFAIGGHPGTPSSFEITNVEKTADGKYALYLYEPPYEYGDEMYGGETTIKYVEEHKNNADMIVVQNDYGISFNYIYKGKTFIQAVENNNADFGASKELQNANIDMSQVADNYQYIIKDSIPAEFPDNYNELVYALYDFEQDGIPELIVQAGTCAADYIYRVFTCRNDEYGVGLYSLGNIPYGNIGKGNNNSILIQYTAMDCEMIWESSITDGYLDYELILEKETNEYTKLDQIETYTIDNTYGLNNL